MPTVNETTQQQARFYDEECNPEFEIHRPHNCGRLYNFLIDYKLKSGLERLPIDIKGKLLLDVCCGSGMTSEYYAKRGANVVGADISLEAVKRAQKRCELYGCKASFVVADTEHLPFKDNAFQISHVHDGLHHLKNPQIGVAELARTASEGMIVTEPAYALGTRIAVLLGVSEDYEEAGNFVYRFRKDELSQWTKQAGFSHSAVKRYLMYYKHEPFSWAKFVEASFVFSWVKALYYLLNGLFGRMGNKIVLTAWGKEEF